jgi:hypothetical protein
LTQLIVTVTLLALPALQEAAVDYIQELSSFSAGVEDEEGRNIGKRLDKEIAIDSTHSLSISSLPL